MCFCSVEAELVHSEAPKARTCRLCSSAPVRRQLSLIYEVGSAHIYSGTDSKRGVAFLFSGSQVELLRFFEGAKGQKRHQGKDAEKTGSSQSCVDWTSCAIDRPQRAAGPPGRGSICSTLQSHLTSASKTNHQWSCCHSGAWPRQTAMF